MTANEVYETLLSSGIADSPAAKLYLEQALEPFIGMTLNLDSFREELRSSGFWTAAAEDIIMSAIKAYEGETLVSKEPVYFEQVKSIKERLAVAIREDTSRWTLTSEQKEAILKDDEMLSRWAKEYDVHVGFQHLLDFVVDDEINEWKEHHSVKRFWTQKLMIEPAHGKNCTLEVCTRGEPDMDEVICAGSLMDCLRKAYSYESNRGFDQYFSLTTAKDNYCRDSFEDLCFILRLDAESLRQQFACKPALDSCIQDAATRRNEPPVPTKPKGRGVSQER